MTDELELLLREEAEEQEEWPEGLLTTGQPGYVRSEGEQRKEAGVQPELDRPEVQGESDSLTRGTMGRVPFESEEGITETTFPAISRRRELRVQRLYRALMETRRAASFSGEKMTGGAGRIPLVQSREEEAGFSTDVFQLDRAFQRDARRYDGGFTWQ